MEIVTRDEALARGLSHYWTGVPCKHGHESRRNTKTTHCLACALARANARKEADPEEYYRKATDLRRRRKESGKLDYRAEYKKNRQNRIKTAVEWAKRNPEKRLAAYHRREAAKRSAGGSFTGDDIRSLLAKQMCKCATCRASLEAGYHIDHVVALSKGGSNDRLNIQLLCPPCNIRKGNTDPITWNQANGYLL